MRPGIRVLIPGRTLFLVYLLQQPPAPPTQPQQPQEDFPCRLFRAMLYITQPSTAATRTPAMIVATFSENHVSMSFPPLLAAYTPTLTFWVSLSASL